MDLVAESRSLLAKISGAPAESITPEMDLVADLGIDSPKALHLLIELEDRLGVELPDEAAAQIRTVGDIDRFLAEHAPGA